MSSDDERARRFVARHFPESARFLATENPDAPLLPVFGPSEVFGGVDDLTPAVAVVRTAMALTREQLSTALGIAFAEIAADGPAESLTDEEVRREIELHLAAQAFHSVDMQMERDANRQWDDETRRVLDTLAAKVDQAYAAPAPVQATGRFEMTGHDLYRVAKAREALANAETLNLLDERAMARTIGRLEVAVQQLVEMADEASTVAGPRQPDSALLGSQPTQNPVYGDGTVTVDTLDHGRVTMSEPAWCEGHDELLVQLRVDTAHISAETAAEYAGIEFLPIRFSQAPFATVQPQVMGDVSDFPGMDPDEMRALAAVVAAYSGVVYSKANELDRIRRRQA